MQAMENPQAPDLHLIWERFSGELRTWFRGQLMGDEHVAEDLLQECFLRVHDGLENLRERDKLGPWVQRIARNLLIDWRRAQSSQLGQTHEDLESTAADPAAVDQGDCLDCEVGSWLSPAIDALDPADRDVLRLTELNGVGQGQAAERLGLTESALKSRALRARARLRASILACCELEFDRRGGIVDYRRRSGECGSCD